MKLETFFEKFDELADTPDAVSRIRRFILDLAVQGKLVAQDMQDEPAEELLKRVQAEKARLVKSGEIKKQEQLPPVGEDAIPFSLPAGWAASQLGDVAVCLDYMREPINGTERELRIAGKTQDELFPYYGATQQQGWIDDFIFDAELVLLGEDGVPFFDALRPKAYLISGKTWVNNHAHVFRGILVSNHYLMHWLNVFDYTGRVAGSTRSKLNQAKAIDIPIALPPLAEQKRIVAKVDELMALCDRLEAQQREREEQAGKLARASLARFADAPTPANLSFLFHPSYAVTPTDLRKSILTLAVQGKLVPQDPNDEEPEVALLELHRARTRQSKAGKLRAAKVPANAFLEDALPFSPDSWRTVSFDHVAVAHNNALKAGPFGSALKKEFYVEKGYKIYGQEQVIAGDPFIGDYYIDEKKFAELESCAVSPGDILISLVGTIGKILVLPEGIEPGIINPRVIKLSLDALLVYPMFIKVLIGSPYAVDFFEENSHGGTMNILNLSILRALPLPLPPLAEQRRIVAKVEQLMALVDALETQLSASRATAANLLAALVAELTGTPTRGKVSTPAASGTGRRGRPRKA